MESFHRTIKLGTRQIGDDFPTFVIAEVGQSHDGSLGMAHAYIDAAAEAGVDAIKFQTHIAQAESTLDEMWRVKFSYQDESRFAYWSRMEFSQEQWAELATHAQDRKLVFLSSPFSLEALELLERLSVPAWKLASGEMNSRFLKNAMVRTGKPLLISTGMSSWPDIDQTVNELRSHGVPYLLFQCTSQYPTGLAEVGLNVMAEFRTRFGCPVGLSDHTGNIDVLMAAVARGANMVEAHITFDRRMFGPDARSSLLVDEFRRLVEFRDNLVFMDNHPVDKDGIAAKLQPTRKLFTRSIALRSRQTVGTVLQENMLTMKKPGSGISESDLPKVINRRLVRDVESSRLLTWEDFE